MRGIQGELHSCRGLEPCGIIGRPDKEREETIMKLIAVNGSARPRQNTARLLEKVIEGAESQGAEAKRFDLYKMDFKGCRGCFACKRKGGKSPHRCAIRDGLAPLLDAVAGADALVVGSPIYFSEITGETRSFLERLMFQYLPYDPAVEDGTYFPRPLRTALVCTMGFPQDPIDDRLAPTARFLSQIFRAPCELLKAQGCYPFVGDYDKYEAGEDAMAALQAGHEENFPAFEQRAFELGVRLVGDGA